MCQKDVVGHLAGRQRVVACDHHALVVRAPQVPDRRHGVRLYATAQRQEARELKLFFQLAAPAVEDKSAATGTLLCVCSTALFVPSGLFSALLRLVFVLPGL